MVGLAIFSVLPTLHDTSRIHILIDAGRVCKGVENVGVEDNDSSKL